MPAPRAQPARLATLLACLLLLLGFCAPADRGGLLSGAAASGELPPWARAEAETEGRAIQFPADGAASAAEAAPWSGSGSAGGAAADARRLLQLPAATRVEKIGYVKTHKTGSTTLGAALFRFGARYHKRFYCQGQPPQACKRAHILRPGAPLPPGATYDLQLNHLSGNGELRGSFGAVIAWYRAMLGTEAGTWRRSGGTHTPPPWALIVPVRDPVAHYMSWFYYFAEPDNHLTLEQWVNTGRGANGLAAEFGLKTEDEVRRFVDSMSWGRGAGPGVMGGAVQLWLPVERFDDAMLLLRRALNWDLLDVSYAVLFDSRRAAATRWDGRRIKPTPKLESLDAGLAERIRVLNALDGVLYDAATAAFDAALAEARGSPGSDARRAWEAEAAEFAAMQDALGRSFDAAGGGEGSRECVQLRHWYQLSDLQYEALVGPDGYAEVPPAAEPDAMRAALARTGGQLYC